MWCHVFLRGWNGQKALNLCLVIFAVLLFRTPDANAEPDFVSLREILEVERDTIQKSIQSSIRRHDSDEFPKEKAGRVFGRYLKSALQTIRAEQEFPEVYRIMKSFKGRVDVEDRTQRGALAVFLGDYMQVRYEGDLIRSLRELVPFKTYNNILEPNHDNPEFHRAFEYLQGLAEKLSLQVVNYGNETLAITLPAGWRAKGNPPVVIFTHIDEMRPVAYKWEQTTPPFTMTTTEGGWIGLGAYSHKGPTLVNLFALRVMLDANLSLQRPVTLLVGSNANSPEASVETSLKKLDVAPRVVLAADGVFPYSTGEMGNLLARVSSDYGMKTLQGIEPETYYIYRATTTASSNTIPAESRIWVLYEDPVESDNPSLDMLNKWRAVIEGYHEKLPHIRLGTYVQGDTLHFFAYGNPGHVETSGRNALMNAAAALQGLPFYRNSAWEIMQFIDETFDSDPSGKASGLFFSHPKMGDTTVNPVQLERVGNEVSVMVDIRWPVGRDRAWIRQWMKEKVDHHNARHDAKLYLEWEAAGREAIIHQPPESVRSLLLNAFELASADFEPPAAPVSHSSGNLLPHAIPFGPEWPGSPKHGHTRHEKVTLRELRDIGVAYVSALAWFALMPQR